MIDVAVILIVEDDCFIRELSEMTIQEWGYQTLSASDTDEALTHLRESLATNPTFIERARVDPDFDPIRGEPGFPA